jgi:hypothetical protein
MRLGQRLLRLTMDRRVKPGSDERHNGTIANGLLRFEYAALAGGDYINRPEQ